MNSSDNGPCLGSRKAKQPYEWLTYRQVLERAENLGSAFLHRGHSRSTDPHIGIFAQNRPEVTRITTLPQLQFPESPARYNRYFFPLENSKNLSKVS